MDVEKIPCAPFWSNFWVFRVLQNRIPDTLKTFCSEIWRRLMPFPACFSECKEGENCFAYYYSYPHRVSNRFFYRFGKFVGTYPRKVIIGMLLLSIVPLIGFAFIMDVIETESEEIFDARSQTKFQEILFSQIRSVVTLLDHA